MNGFHVEAIFCHALIQTVAIKFSILLLKVLIYQPHKTDEELVTAG